MKRLLIPLVFLCCLGCQQGERVLVEPKADVEADIQAVKDLVAEMNAALNTSDFEKFMSLYADDAIEIPPNKPAQIGKEAIRSSIQQFFDEVTCQEEDIVKNIHVSGDLAVAHVIYSGVATPKAGGELRKGKGNIIMVFEKQSDGVWKRTYTIYSNELLDSPTLEE